MGILTEAPRGGLVEDIDNAPRVLILRNAEIERFEDRHRGCFALWDAFFSKSEKPTVREVRDLVALGLCGGGMAAPAADLLVSGLGPDQNQRLYAIANALIGSAFVPDAFDGEAEDAPADDPPEDGEKKNMMPGTSGGL